MKKYIRIRQLNADTISTVGNRSRRTDSTTFKMHVLRWILLMYKNQQNHTCYVGCSIKYTAVYWSSIQESVWSVDEKKEHGLVTKTLVLTNTSLFCFLLFATRKPNVFRQCDGRFSISLCSIL